MEEKEANKAQHITFLEDNRQNPTSSTPPWETSNSESAVFHLTKGGERNQKSLEGFEVKILENPIPIARAGVGGKQTVAPLSPRAPVFGYRQVLERLPTAFKDLETLKVRFSAFADQFSVVEPVLDFLKTQGHLGYLNIGSCRCD
ncbi:hypothetical protein NE237_005619 [Protea cynaroides]|uniref:Uncharacterized protein n=1 Tax=Protea cynaroides TaxID=273540 RepID=A0A9Q0QUD8_9MAGN|nr:hypothetical protein NE237_005619 [Protea cynaroides]